MVIAATKRAVSRPGLIAVGSILRNRPVRTYIAGFHAYEKGNLLRDEGNANQADVSFQQVVSIMVPLLEDRSTYDHRDVIKCGEADRNFTHAT